MFVVLLTTLPIIFHLRTIETYAVATALTMICAIPSLAARAPVRSAAAVMRLMALVLALGAVAWFGRTIVPPATFWLTDSAITDALDEEMRSVSNPLESVCEAQLRGNRCQWRYSAAGKPDTESGPTRRIFRKTLRGAGRSA